MRQGPEPELVDSTEPSFFFMPLYAAASYSKRLRDCVFNSNSEAESIVSQILRVLREY